MTAEDIKTWAPVVASFAAVVAALIALTGTLLVNVLQSRQKDKERYRDWFQNYYVENGIDIIIEHVHLLNYIYIAKKFEREVDTEYPAIPAQALQRVSYLTQSQALQLVLLTLHADIGRARDKQCTHIFSELTSILMDIQNACMFRLPIDNLGLMEIILSQNLRDTQDKLRELIRQQIEINEKESADFKSQLAELTKEKEEALKTKGNLLTHSVSLVKRWRQLEIAQTNPLEDEEVTQMIHNFLAQSVQLRTEQEEEMQWEDTDALLKEVARILNIAVEARPDIRQAAQSSLPLRLEAKEKTLHIPSNLNDIPVAAMKQILSSEISS